jgi:hypothetical protein
MTAQLLYLLQHKRGVWQDTNLIFQGDIQKHLVAVELLHKTWKWDYRLKRITEEEALALQTRGYVVMQAPEKLRNVQDTETTTGSEDCE